jgi:hypothetical protein
VVGGEGVSICSWHVLLKQLVHHMLLVASLNFPAHVTPITGLLLTCFFALCPAVCCSDFSWHVLLKKLVVPVTSFGFPAHITTQGLALLANTPVALSVSERPLFILLHKHAGGTFSEQTYSCALLYSQLLKALLPLLLWRERCCHVVCQRFCCWVFACQLLAPTTGRALRVLG